jgi:hypothetical protein
VSLQLDEDVNVSDFVADRDRDLGCGIGVVLRMIYVLTVVLYRTFRSSAPLGEDDADEEETTVLLVAAPPQYSQDEKVAL